MEDYIHPYLPAAQEAAAERQERRQQYSASLHSVQKKPAKPWKRPHQPSQPRVYRVEPCGFRELVQRLTGAETGSTRRLRDAAPASLKLAPMTAIPKCWLELQQEQLSSTAMEHSAVPDAAANVVGDMRMSTGFSSPEGLIGLLSPSMVPAAYMAWCAHPILSPGTTSSLEPSTVL